MGKTTRRKFTPEFKAKVALEALKESSTKGDLAKKYEISPEMISRWKKKNSWKMPVRHSERSLGTLISTRSAMPSIEKSASWIWTWIFASGYTSSWGYIYPKSTDISNKRDCRQGRKASPVSEQSLPEQTAWDSKKHILLQAQGRRKPEKSEDDGSHG